MKQHIIFLLVALVLAACFNPGFSSLAYGGESISSDIEYLIDNGGYIVTKGGSIVAVHNQQKSFVPASIIKIATSLAALKVLGPTYRFETAFFLDDQNNLYIKGYGDPFLISEEVEVILGRLKELGCKEINNIYLDNTAFDIKSSADGSGFSDNPYDAQNAAISVNFNTVKIEKNISGKVSSAESQTPTLPFMRILAEKIEPGIHRINISWGPADGGNNISQYAGELFRSFQKITSIPGHGIIELRKTPDNLVPFYVHQSSKALEDIIEPLMLYSNNFIANQFFLAVGAAKYGYPATWEKGRQAIAEYLLKTFDLTGKQIKMYEGSGLSRKNRVSAHAMIQLLDAFKPYSHYLTKDEGLLLKSGTLKGIYSYAGYFGGSNNLDSFVLILNQEKNSRDKVLQDLREIYKKN